MDKLKIDHFVREHPADGFPAFRSLTAIDTALIRQNVARALGLALIPDAGSLLEILGDRQKVLDRPNAEATGFDLKACLHSLGISPSDRVFINWHRFDEIDEMNVDDLSTYFASIWYPSSDDIDIFDGKYSWILSVRHDGVLSVLRLN
ncbi:MAG TPA: hypothetical protein VKA43_12295 [Gammaproteobacteria bacterium]|nr:hypothetical protein [Gammaproteobacteria bacterium]